MSEVIEIVSDSEEERIRGSTIETRPTVIEISSSEDDDSGVTARPIPAKNPTLRHRTTRKVVELSSESEDEAPRNPPANAIDLIPDGPSDQCVTPVQDKAKAPARPAAASRYQSLYSDSEDSDGEVFEDAIDDSILTFDPPKSAKKPIGITPATKAPFRETAPKKRTATPKRSTTSNTQQTPPAINPTPRSSKKVSKKAQAAAEQREREEYAQQFFNDLNETVFKNGLPPDTKLAWNARLLTTAGRARWHKNRHGEESSQIELAVKILTSKERIRSTLSHEMCHLASWTIDKQLNEGHGQIFKKWGSRVMKTYPDIEVTTRHTYEISYRYEWKCANCSKIYGRHSKSINPDQCLCGACKTGNLIPLFATRTPQKTKASSKMATTQPRDSPLRGQDIHTSVPTDDEAPDFLDDLDDLTAAVQYIRL